MTTLEVWSDEIIDAALDIDVQWIERPRRAVVGNPNADWSSCCDGLLAVELSEFYYSGDQWPYQGTARPGVLGPMDSDVWTANWAVSIVRCLPSVDEDGRAPTPEQLRLSAHNLMADTRTVFNAISCARSRWFDTIGAAFLPGPWRPLNREGGCGGFQFNVYTKLCGLQECG
ncbi:MAG: hypothetical protein ACOYOQ_00030 [Microthrixaceae bacterium]